MKKILITLFLLPTLVFAQNNGFTINGNVSGVEDGTVKLTSTQDASQVLVTGAVTKGAFTLKGSIPEPGLYWLAIGSEQPVYLYVENSTIHISGSKSDIKNIKIEGSASHKDFDAFQATFNPLIGNLNGVAAQMQKTEKGKAKEELMKQYQELVSKINTEVDAYVKGRKSSYVSPFVLFVTAQLIDDYQVLENRFNLLTEEVRNSNIGRSFRDFIAYNKVGTVGTMALEFTQNDTAGNAVTFSSFKGKYVLVDFWASWCRPCRIENPNVVNAFNKFKAKNFTVLGISLDQEKDAWVKAIAKDKLTWTHVSDLAAWNNSVAQMYRIQSIPQNILVDPTGKIIAKDLRGPDLEKKLCELLGCK
jgi:peroxiredoxin